MLDCMKEKHARKLCSTFVIGFESKLDKRQRRVSR